jgi:hypothetical protein
VYEPRRHPIRTPWDPPAVRDGEHLWGDERDDEHLCDGEHMNHCVIVS